MASKNLVSQIAAAFFLIAPMVACKHNHGNSQSEPKIVGGLSVDFYEDQRLVEQTVSLSLLDAQGGITRCTGTVFTPRHILTAAHCLKNSQVVEIGSGARSESLHSLGSIKFATHPQWTAGPAYDLAVISTARYLPLKNALLINKDSVKVGEKLILAGYGVTGQLEKDSGRLRYTETKIASIDTEAGILKVEAGNNRGGCFGDSGGPGYVERSGFLGLAGVISGGSINAPCDVGHGALTSVSKNIEWITCVSKKLSGEDAEESDQSNQNCKSTELRTLKNKFN